jgi:hypothetical protein
MRKSAMGYQPCMSVCIPIFNFSAPGCLQEMMDMMPELKDRRMPRFVLKEYNPLLDSSDMEPDDWYHLFIAHWSRFFFLYSKFPSLFDPDH